MTDSPPRPWPRAAATGVGSLPGDDIVASTALAFDQTPDLPFAPELPARGPGADLVGRASGRLVDLYVDLQPSGWRVVPRPGIDWRRIQDFWGRDLDALEQYAEGYTGALKIQLCGPWTLGASVEMVNGHKALRDSGARRDLSDSLTEGAVRLLAELYDRVPGAQLLLQLDEPLLPRVLSGGIKTPSGFGRIDAVDPIEVQGRLRDLIHAVKAPVLVHCCAAQAPIDLVAGAGARAISLDLALVGEAQYDELGESMDRGLDLVAGAIATDVQPSRSSVDDATVRVRQLADALGVSAESLPDRIVISPACGLAGSTPDRAAEQLRAARVVAGRLADPDDEERRG